jgi:hypothetical protein
MGSSRTDKRTFFMRFASIAVMLVGVLANASSSSVQRPAPSSPPSSAITREKVPPSPTVARTVDTYCSSCHNGVMLSPSRQLLDRIDSVTFGDNKDVWTRSYRQMAAGTMPPVGAPRPDRATYDAVLAAVETRLGGRAPLPADASSDQIAERLARLVWNGAPDASLAEAARTHALANPATLERQIQRMLADDRAEAFVTGFFVPWLGLDQLAKADPDTRFFPDYDVSLRDAMYTETDLFLRSQLRENRDPLEVWNARYTFLNERLARHYDVPGVKGSEFRRVALTSPERAGLLGQGSILMVTSRHQHGTDAAYTSPAARSTWIRWHFLGARNPMPFPGATQVKPELPSTPQTRALPAEPSENCQRNFFPLGYALENFDAIGGWRIRDQAGPVDASGAYVDGASTDGIVELRNVLLRYPDAFRTTITEKLIFYFASQPVTASRMTPESLVRARQVLNSVKNPRWSSLIAAIVRM